MALSRAKADEGPRGLEGQLTYAKVNLKKVALIGTQQGEAGEGSEGTGGEGHGL